MRQLVDFLIFPIETILTALDELIVASSPVVFRPAVGIPECGFSWKQ
jgi:hypothetical protein